MLASIALLAVGIGASAAAVTPGPGSWANGTLTGVVCIHMALLPGPSTPAPGLNPRIVCVERPHDVGARKPAYKPNSYTGGRNTVEWNPYAAPNTFDTASAKIHHSASNPFCGGHSMQEDGTFLLVGGDKTTVTNPLNLQANVNDGTNGIRRYTQSSDLAAGATSVWSDPGRALSKSRWYPIVTTIGTGEVFIAGGVAEALNLDVFKTGKTFNNPSFEWHNSPRAGLAGYPKDLDVLNKTDPLNLYPFTTQLPLSGKLFMFVGNYSILIDPATEKVTDLPTLANTKHKNKIYPFTPTVTMMPLTLANNYTATFLVCGGTLRDKTESWAVFNKGDLVASSWCSSIRPEDPNPQWEEDVVKWDGNGRMMPDSVVLPDARVLYMNGATYGMAGGDSGIVDNAHNPNFDTDLYDPVNKTFFKAAPFKVGRLYHSNALLLPDGRVITAGNEMANYPDIDGTPNRVVLNQCFPGVGNATVNATNNVVGCTDPFEYRSEIYTPYYKTLPNPPEIDQGLVPRKLGYGSVFAVGLKTPPANVTTANIIRYASSTHSTNTDQRYVELRILGRNTSHVFLSLPDSNTVAPPGLWMLFLVGNSGAIGVSATVHITNAGPKLSVTVPTTPPGSNPNAAGQTRTPASFGVSWTLAMLVAFIGTVMLL